MPSCCPYFSFFCPKDWETQRSALGAASDEQLWDEKKNEQHDLRLLGHSTICKDCLQANNNNKGQDVIGVQVYAIYLHVENGREECCKG
ncbi:predicted protein [Lichtheimia corymbifera JMRC:FSU:9682]|uniref:Uncharacterized protein n=1 Tax=Lichtheimia corymbifera JMRC:FSU:9682 TaxID=1263082 RepID=A0A068SA13_9FUNG|nr:predicted protein [Lichtheimia corymbifera JMRC:FSU:9682]